jgi:hypothetical protein
VAAVNTASKFYFAEGIVASIAYISGVSEITPIDIINEIIVNRIIFK